MLREFIYRFLEYLWGINTLIKTPLAIYLVFYVCCVTSLGDHDCFGNAIPDRWRPRATGQDLDQNLDAGIDLSRRLRVLLQVLRLIVRRELAFSLGVIGPSPGVKNCEAYLRAREG